LHPTWLSRLEIGGHTRLQLFLRRKLFHETRRAGEAGTVRPLDVDTPML